MRKLELIKRNILIYRTLILSLIFYFPSCVTTKPNEYKFFKTGKIIIDKSNKGVYVPDDLNKFDIVFLNYQYVDPTIIHLKSEYHHEKIIDLKHWFTGCDSKTDSIYLNFYTPENYQMAFVSLTFLDSNRAAVNTYRFINQGDRKHYSDEIMYFQLFILNRKSDLYELKKAGDTLNIEFNYLDQRNFERYTYIDTIIRL